MSSKRFLRINDAGAWKLLYEDDGSKELLEAPTGVTPGTEIALSQDNGTLEVYVVGEGENMEVLTFTEPI